ncbi:hypothetical protein WA1_11640 [Scytonema hofmannii PCC 7110]|uniref:Iron ABC transporter substrate-binding protein n=1 Tax=Scytonema hofmannii PCC 7110 TaxID=128403 RepID=A0A139XDJ8_9CYAN|nr:hypothetical protein [Scytonema hofmannii]KYC42781.1 hypothetical protein WA1_11640 [Scytonema hofmannii PCC 7110]
MMPTQVQQISFVIAATLLVWGVEISAQAAPKKLTIYSGREEKIMSPLIEKAEKDLEWILKCAMGTLLN